MSEVNMIEIRGLVKQYKVAGSGHGKKASGKKFIRALDGIDLTVKQGEIIGILGPNGAGKTTMLKVLAGFIYPDEGDVKVNGFDVMGDRHEVRCSCNFLRSGGWVVFDYKYPLDRLLEFWGGFMGLRREEAKKASLRTLKIVGLHDNRNNYVENLSAGMRQRLNLARCLLVQRPVYLLDEPTDNLDPYSRDFILRFVREELAKEGTTIILATHNLWEAEAVCDRLVILDEGKILRIGTPADIKREASDERLVLQLGDGVGDLVPEISNLEFVVDVQTPEDYSIEGRKERNVLLVYGKGLHGNISKILEITKRVSEPKYLDIQTPSLNEIFVQIIEERKRGGGGNDD